MPVAVTVPREVSACGGFRRREPVGGWANGIPLNLSTEPEVEPMMVAAGEAIATVGVVALLAGAASTTGRAQRMKLKNFMMGIVEVQSISST